MKTASNWRKLIVAMTALAACVLAVPGHEDAPGANTECTGDCVQ